VALPFDLEEGLDPLRFGFGEEEIFRERLVTHAAEPVATTVDHRGAFRAPGGFAGAGCGPSGYREVDRSER